MVGLLAFLIGLFLVLCSIPVKTIQLALFAKKTKMKIDAKKDKSKNSKLTKGINKLKARLNVIGKKDGRKNDKPKNKTVVHFKQKMLDALIVTLKGLGSVLFATGQSLMATGIFAVLIMLIELVAIIAACSSVVIFVQSNQDIVDTSGLMGNVEEVEVSTGNVEDAVRIMSEWYSSHVATYKGVYEANGKPASEAARLYYESIKNDKDYFYVDNHWFSEDVGYYYCSLIDAFVSDDEYGYATALASFICGNKINLNESKNRVEKQTEADTFTQWAAMNFNFRRFETSSLDSTADLKCGDILVNNNSIAIYISDAYSYDWFEIHDNYPLNTPVILSGSAVLISMDLNHIGDVDAKIKDPYTALYRYLGEPLNYNELIDYDFDDGDDEDETEDGTEEETEEETEEKTEEEGETGEDDEGGDDSGGGFNKPGDKVITGGYAQSAMSFYDKNTDEKGSKTSRVINGVTLYDGPPWDTTNAYTLNGGAVDSYLNSTIGFSIKSHSIVTDRHCSANPIEVDGVATADAAGFPILSFLDIDDNGISQGWSVSTRPRKWCTVLQDKDTGEYFYLPNTCVGDAKGHVWPGGVSQTFLSTPQISSQGYTFNNDGGYLTGDIIGSPVQPDAILAGYSTVKYNGTPVSSTSPQMCLELNGAYQSVLKAGYKVAGFISWNE